MLDINFLDSIPLWLLYPLTFLLAYGAFEIGYRYGIYWRKKTNADVENEMSALSGATLAMLAFLLAFVVSIATSRYDTRRQLVVEEANAIHTAYLRAGYLPDPYPSDIRSILQQYLDVRLKAVQGSNVSLEDAKLRSEQLQGELWSATEAVVKANPGRDEISAYIESVNDVINVGTTRATIALNSRLPAAMVLGIYLVAALAMMITGFQIGHAQKRNLFGILVMIALFTLVIMLIIDLDRPQEGFLQVSQQALIDLQRLIGTPTP
ncbi:MAG TPA: hypothetical protein VMJ64_16830 [Anaerolineales bacterium]|nr:hypothetical protein [Anaerolineales bacterium]